ncbi:hypothetical protein Cus16_2873 [Curtobacterium sp. ER1/6]|nr:hypothetical protein Cus16_2873 [Curtobacterium sp. ER1/6]
MRTPGPPMLSVESLRDGPLRVGEVVVGAADLLRRAVVLVAQLCGRRVTRLRAQIDADGGVKTGTGRPRVRAVRAAGDREATAAEVRALRRRRRRRIVHGAAARIGRGANLEGVVRIDVLLAAHGVAVISVLAELEVGRVRVAPGAGAETDRSVRRSARGAALAVRALAPGVREADTDGRRRPRRVREASGGVAGDGVAGADDHLLRPEVLQVVGPAHLGRGGAVRAKPTRPRAAGRFRRLLGRIQRFAPSPISRVLGRILRVNGQLVAGNCDHPCGLLHGRLRNLRCRDRCWLVRCSNLRGSCGSRIAVREVAWVYEGGRPFDGHDLPAQRERSDISVVGCSYFQVEHAVLRRVLRQAGHITDRHAEGAAASHDAGRDRRVDERVPNLGCRQYVLRGGGPHHNWRSCRKGGSVASFDLAGDGRRDGRICGRGYGWYSDHAHYKDPGAEQTNTFMEQRSP